jgi:hypothetical protein
MVDGEAVSPTVFHATIATIDCLGDRHPSAILHERACLTVGGHGLLTTPVEGPWIISDAHEKPAGAPHVHERITEICSEPTHGIAGAYPGRLIRGCIVARRCASSRPVARFLQEQAEPGREAVGDACMVSTRHPLPVW